MKDKDDKVITKTCKNCNCNIHNSCHIHHIEMGYQGLLLTGFKSSGWDEHFKHADARRLGY